MLSAKVFAKDEIACDDVLAAMADSVLSTITGDTKVRIFKVEQQKDREVSISVGGKPPRQIFYRKTVIFKQAFPQQVGKRRCTCASVCTGAVATIKCMSCKIYDPTGMGYFCDMCFQHSHPWYRVPHIYMGIEKDENVQQALQVAHRKAEIVRYQKDGRDTLANVMSNESKLEYLADDLKIETNMREAGRKITDTVSRILGFQEQLRKEVSEYDNKVGDDNSLRRKLFCAPTSEENATGGCDDGSVGSSVSMTSSMLESLPSASSSRGGGLLSSKGKGKGKGVRGGAEAAVKVQAFLRGCGARRIVSHAYADRLVKVFDGRSGRDFYYNKATNESSWSLPSFVRGADADRIADFDEEGIGSSGSLKAGRYDDDKRLHWCVKRGAARRVRAPGDDGAATSSEAAARVLNSFGRCILARKRALKTAEGRFNRIVEDANTI